ncbi:MAG: amino acid permease [Gammaproteobacteria bacterium]
MSAEPIIDIPVDTPAQGLENAAKNPAASLATLRLMPILSNWEVWGFGFTGLLLWIMAAPGAHAVLGPQAILMWIPIVIVGVMINLQVRQMAAHWPDMAGGTANYTSRLFNNSWVGRYAAMAYFQGWASVPTISAIILADITMQNLNIVGIFFPDWILRVAFTALAFLIAFAGTRALSVLHLCFVIPAVGFLLLFCVQGAGWLTFSSASPGLLPIDWGQFNFAEWAKWFFVATYAVYAVETSSSFMADARKPTTILRCLKTAAWIMPVVFIGGSWVLMQLSTGAEIYHDNIYQNLVQAALPFWGDLANLMVIFFVASACLLSCATGCANSPRVVYQLARDGHAAPVFGIASRRNVPGPALVLTLIISLIFLLWGDMTRVLVVTGTGYFVIFLFMHLGLWLNRGKSYVRWPWWALGFFVAELVIFVVGGIAWGWQDFLMGLLFPIAVMMVDALIRRFPVGIFNPVWWQQIYSTKRYNLVNDGIASQVALLILFVCGAAAIGWGLSGLVDGVRTSAPGVNLFAILILVIAFLGVAAACWTTLPKLALVEDAREQAVTEAHALLTNSYIATLMVDHSKVIRLANAPAGALFGTYGSLTGTKLHEILPPSLSLDEEFMEHTLTRPDGSQRIVEISISSLEGAGLTEYIVTLHDITEHKLTQAKLRANEERFRTLYQDNPAMYFTLDAAGNILSVNERGAEQLGYTIDELLGQPVLNVFYEADKKTVLEAFNACLQNPGQITQWEFRKVRKGGGVIWVSEIVRPIVSANGDITVLVVCEDITNRKLAETRLTYLANYDPLTNLPNRTLFYDRLTQAITRLPWNNRLAAVLFLDIDRFKLINDTLGHGTADLMLKAIGERLMDCVREGDTVARLGGDEFTVLLADVASEEDVGKVAQKILDVIAKPYELDGHQFYVTTSIGISLWQTDGTDAVTLLKHADSAMYAAKDREGNNYQFYSASMGVQSSGRLVMENALHQALERDEFLLYYQPLIDFTTGEVAGVEALLRWNCEGKLISPADFIPLAEETGLIIPIGEWVLRTACAQNKAWQDQGLPPMRVAVNLSGRQLQLPHMRDVVAGILKETGLEPGYLELELTESMMQSLEATGTLRALKELGVRLAIDDFGTGYSSLSYLQRYPLHKLKIDQSFMRNLPADENNVAIVTAIVAMARSLNLKVTAEGVETAEQLAFLRTLECDELQGYLFSRPMPTAELTKMLKTIPMLPKR